MNKFRVVLVEDHLVYVNLYNVMYVQLEKT